MQRGVRFPFQCVAFDKTGVDYHSAGGPWTQGPNWKKLVQSA